MGWRHFKTGYKNLIIILFVIVVGLSFYGFYAQLEKGVQALVFGIAGILFLITICIFLFEGGRTKSFRSSNQWDLELDIERFRAALEKSESLSLKKEQRIKNLNKTIIQQESQIRQLNNQMRALNLHVAEVKTTLAAILFFWENRKLYIKKDSKSQNGEFIQVDIEEFRKIIK